MESVDDTTWRKASYSGSNGAQCVEIASTTARGVAVRDTTDRDGVTLTLPASAWRDFLRTLR
ncbi:MAG: DUF397 domain-containing protein [Nocardiopsaceae bacterium]|nr:DUF397 domain-containing protein [Nocardiopsaceae bacterium]